MNAHLMWMEIAVIVSGLALLMIDLWTAPEKKAQFGWVAAGLVAAILAASFLWSPAVPGYAFNNSFVIDPLALYFKRLFLLAAVFVLVMATDFSDRLGAGITEFYVLILFALAGMLFAASTKFAKPGRPHPAMAAIKNAEPIKGICLRNPPIRSMSSVPASL